MAMTGAADGADNITADAAQRLLGDLTEIVSRASAIVMATHFSKVARRAKDDLSPVTEADEASERIILEGLAKVLPGVPVIAEESVARAPAKVEASCVIVDPLDGTKEFLAGRDEFTVNIGIATNGIPIAGVISAPAQGLLWRGVVGGKAERLKLNWGDGPSRATDLTPIQTRKAPTQFVVATSRTHLDAQTEEFLSKLPETKRYPCGSSVKFCHLAQGDADVYPRLSPTCEWDIAAGCAILTAAGGKVIAPDGSELRFGSAANKFLVPGFLAFGDPKAVRSR
jgi:3'(2'), 5'-bisphosphate nucleotidase